MEWNGRNAEFFANKNIVTVDGKTIEMEGVAHYNQGNGIFYVPAQGVSFVTGAATTLPEIKR